MIEPDLLDAMRLDQERRGLLASSMNKKEVYLRAIMLALGDRSILDASTEDIQSFLDRRGIGPRTRYLWVSHLHSFYKWAVAERGLAIDPTEVIVRPKPRRTLPRPAPREALAVLLEAGTPQQSCWVLLAAYQGLRCREVAGLRREDVLDHDGLLRVLGKGDHERMLALHPQVSQALRTLPMPRAGFVFRRPRGGVYTPAALSRYFNEFIRDQGFDFTAHQLRHWFATELYLESGHDLRGVQSALGHADPGTTAGYTSFDQGAIGEALRRISVTRPDEAA